MPGKKKISFTIPVYNNEGSIEKTFLLITGLFSNTLRDYEYEVIFTDDGSADGSLQELLKVKGQNEKVKVISFSKNFGQIPATIAAHRASTGDAVITISADLQDPTEMIPKMVKEWENGSDIVICHRTQRKDSFLNKITSRIYFKIIKFHSNPLLPEGGFDYFLISRKPLNVLNTINDHIRGLHYDIFSLGFKIAFLPYVRLERPFGKSQYNFRKRFFDFLNAFISISYLPIRAMTIIGIFFFFAGFIYSLSIAYSWYYHKTPFEGWAPIMILILVIGGILMLMLGIIGEYIWRIYTETKKRPYYIIKDVYE